MELDKSWESVLDPGKATDYFAARGDVPHLHPAATQWDLGTAWWCSEISRAIYRREGRLELFARASLKELQFFDEGSTQAALVAAKDFCVLVFRGTADLRDWLTNLRVAPGEWPGGGRVHQGFARASAKVWQAICSALHEVSLPTFATGHSLGGALATLAASQHRFQATYTFGAPRVGDDRFWQTLQGPLHRVVHDKDVVPTLPPRRLGYAHGGYLVHLRADGVTPTRTTADSLADGNGSLAANSVDRIIDARRWFQPPPPLRDHAPSNYSRQLLRLVGS